MSTEAQNVNALPVKAGHLPSDDLRSIKSFDDALKVLSGLNVIPEDVKEYGDGVEIVEDKRTLLKVPFLILSWQFREGDHGKYVSLVAVTENGEKHIINDGSTGILRQMEDITALRIARGMAPETAQYGLLCRKGLRSSDYTYTDDKGKEKLATTFYIAN